MPENIPAEELQLLRQLVRPGILLSLMLRMGQLPSIKKTAALMELDYRTVRSYVKHLVQLGYLQPLPRHAGYTLADSLSETQKNVLAFFGFTHSRGA
jgi:Fic family protein